MTSRDGEQPRRRVGIGPPRVLTQVREPAPGEASPAAPRPDRQAQSVGAILAPLGLRGPLYMQQLEVAAGEPARLAAVWLEIGDALANLGRADKAKVAWVNGANAAEGAAARAVAASLSWRLGQVAEAFRELGEAIGWYDRAADIFRREQATHDETVARMAVARVTLHASGAGQARQVARDAVLLARETDDAALLAQALELSAEVSFELGLHDEAVASFREALRQFERAGDPSARVRVAVALADVLLESGQSLQALAALEIALPHLESHESLETRGRGMGILGLVNLDIGQIAEAAGPLKQAHEWLEAAQAVLRRARLLVATGRRLEARSGPAQALPLYEHAWRLAKQGSEAERFRLAPIAFALARCQLLAGDFVRADETIIIALRQVQESGDLEGLALCTELGVRIAARLSQGKLALERLLMLARTQVRMGEAARALRTFRNALEATLGMSREDTDIGLVCDEFMELLRQRGTGLLGPGEAMKTANDLADADRAGAAAEIAVLEAERHLSDSRPAEAARTFAKAASWAMQDEERWIAVEHWDRAIELGERVGLNDVEAWKADRTWAAEG